MKNIIIFDAADVRDNLLPITYTRPVSHIRIGIDTIFEKWQSFFPGEEISPLTVAYLQKKFPATIAGDNFFVAGHIIPTKELAVEVLALNPGEALMAGDSLIAFRGSLADFEQRRFATSTLYHGSVRSVHWLYDIFLMNGEVMADDFRRITAGRTSQPLSSTNLVIGNPTDDNGSPRIFIEEGATVEGVTLNVNAGPIYIGRDATIMEGSCIRAPFAACSHSQVNMCTKIYGATTLGPYCKVGGELNNVVMLGYSNKAHDGFLGNAVIGEWCNLGGGTTASNLKNDYSEIKLWNYPAHRFLRTGLQFCGLIMGDHSKAGINCMFNTATVIGVGVNIHGAGFPRNFVASFLEGSTSGYVDVALPRFFTIAERVMVRRGIALTETDKEIFTAIYNIADSYK
ncbi:MAG: putative sugar nucleotidyl transferase [Bacteroidales bacterium]|nr:putative sugar nucleotidyl transferase [Bacteroidales bacterium]